MSKLEYKNGGKIIFTKMGRRQIFFTDHSLDRWWERCKENGLNGRNDALKELDKQLETATWERSLPAWVRASWWHHARTEGFIDLEGERGFIINKNPSRDLVAVTYIENIKNYRRAA